jgi:hypothetical protein
MCAALAGGMSLKISGHARPHSAAPQSSSKAPSIAQIKTVITKAYTDVAGGGWFKFDPKLQLKAVPRTLVGTPLATAYSKYWNGKNDTYDYSSLFKLNLDGKTVYALESVTDAVDDLRVYNDKGHMLVSNLSGSWSK